MFKSFTLLNVSALKDFNQQLGKLAIARENLLITLKEDLSYINSDVMKILAPIVAKITEATNQLTRYACVNIILTFVFMYKAFDIL